MGTIFPVATTCCLWLLLDKAELRGLYWPVLSLLPGKLRGYAACPVAGAGAFEPSCLAMGGSLGIEEAEAGLEDDDACDTREAGTGGAGGGVLCASCSCVPPLCTGAPSPLMPTLAPPTILGAGTWRGETGRVMDAAASAGRAAAAAAAAVAGAVCVGMACV